MKNLLFTIGIFFLGLHYTFSTPVIIKGHVAPKFRDTLYLTAYRTMADFVLYDSKKMLISKVIPDADGNFRISFEKKHEITFNLKFNNIYVFNSAFFMPGDSVFVNINDTEFGGQPFQYPMIHFHGFGAYSLMYNQLYDRADFTKYLNSYSLSADSFTSLIDSLKNANEAFINQNSIKLNLPPAYQDLLKINALYNWKNEKLVYIWMHDQNRSQVKVEPSYFNFVSETDLHNVQGLHSHTYYRFLSEYPQDLWFEKVIRMPKAKQEEINRSWNVYTRRGEAKIIDSLFQDKMRDAAYCELISNALMAMNHSENVNITEQLNLIDSLLDILKPSSDPDVQLVYSRLKEKRNRMVSLDNSPAPLFTLSDTNKKIYSLAEFKGKVVLLDFWEPGCVPCMQAIPNSNKLQADLSGKDFKMLSVCFSPTDDLCKWALRKYSWNGTHLLANQQSNLMEKYAFDGYPHYVLIDKKGIIRNSNARMDLERLEKEIGVLLSE